MLAHMRVFFLVTGVDVVDVTGESGGEGGGLVGWLEEAWV